MSWLVVGEDQPVNQFGVFDGAPDFFMDSDVSEVHVGGGFRVDDFHHSLDSQRRKLE